MWKFRYMYTPPASPTPHPNGQLYLEHDMRVCAVGEEPGGGGWAVGGCWETKQLRQVGGAQMMKCPVHQLDNLVFILRSVGNHRPGVTWSHCCRMVTPAAS